MMYLYKGLAVFCQFEARVPEFDTLPLPPSAVEVYSTLKVVSSENKGGSKIAPIVAYWLGTVALGIILNF
jgi:hypothetical protein